MRQKKGFAFAVREGWLGKPVVSESEQDSRAVPGPHVPDRALRSITPGVDLENSSPDDMRCRIKCRADFPEVSLQLLDPSCMPSSLRRIDICGNAF